MLTTQIQGYKYRWLVLTVVLVAEIMDLLDATIVNVGGPALAQELNASATELQWVIGGYALALGSGLILGGRLGDRFGRRNMFLFGLIGFTLASLACALAPTVLVLIVLRFVQGFLGAMLLPQGFGLIRDAFPPAEFGKAFAAYGPAFGLGGIPRPGDWRVSHSSQRFWSRVARGLSRECSDRHHCCHHFVALRSESAGR